MVQETRDWLLEEENPSVRYLTLTSLLGHAEDSSEVRRTRDEIMKRGVVPALLDLQNDDGSWGTPVRFYTDKYRGTVWNLIVLAEMRADPEDPGVKKACEFILSNSQETELGGFRILEAPRDCQVSREV